MEFKTIVDSNIQVTLRLEGNLDAEGCRFLQPIIDDVIWKDSHQEVELDFRKVTFLDSSGVGALVYLYKRLVESERKMRIEYATGQPLEIIKLLRIGQAIPVNSHTY